jgi:hypothetical protein
MSAVQFLFPQAQGSYNTWANGAGAVPWNVGEGSDDGDTTYRVKTGGTTGRDSYTVNAMPAAAAVNLYVVYMKPRRAGAGGGTTKGFCRYSGSDTDGVGRAIDIGYTMYSDPLSRPGGGSWDETSVNASEIGCAKTASGAANTNLTYMTLGVDYDPPAGGFAYLINSIIGATIGANITFGMMRDILRDVWIKSRGTRIITPDECWRAFQELKEDKHVCYQF